MNVFSRIFASEMCYVSRLLPTPPTILKYWTILTCQMIALSLLLGKTSTDACWRVLVSCSTNQMCKPTMLNGDPALLLSTAVSTDETLQSGQLWVAGWSATSAVTVKVTSRTCESIAYVLDTHLNSSLAGFHLDGFPRIESEMCSILEACSDSLYVDMEGVTVLWGPLYKFSA